MTSAEYRSLIATIIRNSLSKEFPGLKLKSRRGNWDFCNQIARTVHARMYGANVDGVDSPIWSIDRQGTNRVSDPRTKPNIDAKELLNEA